MTRPALLAVAAAAVTAAIVAAQAPAPWPSPPLTINSVVATIDVEPLPQGVGIQGIALNLDRTRLYVSQGSRTTRWDPQMNRCTGGMTAPQPGTGGVGVFDTNTRTRVDDLDLASGFPVHVELDPSTGRIFAAASPDWIYAFEGTAQVASANVGAVPHDIGIDHSNGRGVVTNTAGPGPSQFNITLVNLANLQTIAQVNTGGFGPHKAAVDPPRHLAYISHADFNKVDVVDTATGSVLRQITTGLGQGGAQNAIDLSRRRLYVVGTASSGTSASFVAINLETEQPVGQALPLPFGGHGMRVDSNTGFIWVVLEEQHQVAVIDPDTLQERLRVNVGHCPYYLDIDPVRRLAYVTNQGDNTISVVDMTVDNATPSVSIGDVTVTEGQSGTTNASFTVSLSFFKSSTATVNFATASGTAAAGRDFTASSGTVTFGAGTTSQSATVAVIGETLVENTETFTVTLSSPSGATLGDAQGVGTIANDDAFADDPLGTGSTAVRGVHVTELRTNINALRTGHGLGAFNWTDPTLAAGSTEVKAVHLNELRSALDAVYQAAGQAAPTYTDTPVTAGATVIKAAHINEMRAAIRNAP